MEAAQPVERDIEANAPSAERKWKRPRYVFALLTLLYLWVFADRGIIASNAVNGVDDEDDETTTALSADIHMSKTQNGLLASLVTAGLLAGCPATARLLRLLNPLFVIGAGMSLWCLALFASGFSMNYYFLAVCRFFMGFGQYPVFSIGSILVDELAPKESVTLWFAVYYLSGPLGVAVGFVYSVAVTQYFSWRYAFWFEAAVALPLVAMCFVQSPPNTDKAPVHSNEEQSATNAEASSLWKDVKQLASHVVFSVTISGDVLYSGFLGCFEYWGARQVNAMFEEGGTDIFIGGVLVLTATIGSILGGFGLDRIGSSIFNALSVASLGCFLSAAVFAPAMMYSNSFYLLAGLYFVAMILLFLPQGPLGGATLWTIPTELRRLGRDVRIIGQNLLGNVPAPTVYGIILDALERDRSENDAFRLTGVASCSLLFASSVLFATAILLSRNSRDYRDSS